MFQSPSEANCNDTLQYSYSLNGGLFSANQSAQATVFYLDGTEEFVFSVEAVNSVGRSEFRSKSGTSGALSKFFKNIFQSIKSILSILPNIV